MRDRGKLLGMPFGTANNRLMKTLLFYLVKRLGEHYCHVCGDEIADHTEMSIEHIKPWENRDPSLFWDVENNVAFSHRACNKRHVNPGAKVLRRIGPKGTAWCSGHQAFLPTRCFSKDKYHWNGLYDRCKECDGTQKKRRARKTRRTS